MNEPLVLDVDSCAAESDDHYDVARREDHEVLDDDTGGEHGAELHAAGEAGPAQAGAVGASGDAAEAADAMAAEAAAVHGTQKNSEDGVDGDHALQRPFAGREREVRGAQAQHQRREPCTA